MNAFQTAVSDEDLAGIQLYRKGLRKRKRQKVLLSLAGIVMFLLLWQVVSSSGFAISKYLPSPVKTMDTFFYKLSHKAPDGNVMLDNILASAKVSLYGFCLAAGIGIPLGLCMGWFKSIDRFAAPVFELIRPIPPIAWIPVIVVLLGVNIKARAFIIFLATFVPCVLNSYTGIKLTNKTFINVAKTFGAGNFETFWKVGIPSAMPMVFTGAKISLGGAWSTLVAAEMLASNAGLGNMLSAGRKLARPDIVVLAMAVIGAIGALLMLVLNRVEKRILRWKKGR